MIYYFSAILASAFWAMSGVISKKPVNYLNGFHFNCIRMNIVTLFLLGVILFRGIPSDISGTLLTVIIISGVIGIFLGDTFLFMAMDRLGPRRTSILFSTNSLLTLLMGYVLYAEIISWRAALGVVLLLFGLLLAVVYGSGKKNPHSWDEIKGKPIAGIALGLLAALGQSAGIIIIKPVMEQQMDPFFMSFIRVFISMLLLNLVYFLYFKKRAEFVRRKITLKLLLHVGTSGIFGIGIGMTLVLFALAGGKSGIVSVLSSLSPVLILPIIWATSKQKIFVNAWVGAALVVIGTSLILYT